MMPDYEEKLLVRLSAKDLIYLDESVHSSQEIKLLLRELSDYRGPRSVSIELPISTVASIVDALSDRLVECGFDENYSLNNEGIVIDNIIDKFTVFKKHK